MKKLSILAAAALLLCACTDKNRYVIEGNVAGLEGTAYLYDPDDKLLDSTAVEAGAFRFKGVVAQSGLCANMCKPSSFRSSSNPAPSGS